MTEQAIVGTPQGQPDGANSGNARPSGSWYWIAPGLMVAGFVALAAFGAGTCF